MKKEPFKQGDRVSVYGYARQMNSSDVLNFHGSRATIVEILPVHEGYLTISVGTTRYSVHANQLRRIVKVPSKIPALFVRLYSDGAMVSSKTRIGLDAYTKDGITHECVRYVAAKDQSK